MSASNQICDTDPRLAAAQVLERWARAFTDSDVSGIVDLYADDASFIGTSSKSPTHRPDDVRAYFEAALLNNRPRSASINEHAMMALADNVVVISGLDTVTGNRNGTVYSIQGRFSFVIEKRDSCWKIVHFHRSALPP